MRRGADARWTKAGLAGIAALALAMAGCTTEPGDEGRQQASKGQKPPSSNALPVAGTVLYQMGGGRKDVLARIGVHALRRTGKGTVLDWSLTPLSAKGVADGAEFTAGANDLDSSYVKQAIELVDPAGGKVYRPLLTGKTVGADCLCRPYFGYSTRLKLGETSLFQIVFPTLPDSVTSLAVAFNGGSIVPGVPVTAEGKVPTAGEAADLAAAPEDKPLAETKPFRYPQGDEVSGKPPVQQMTIAVDGLYSYQGGTTLLWSVKAFSAGDGLATDGRPASDYALHPFTVAYKSDVADGPALLPAGQDAGAPLLRATYSTMRAKTEVQSGQTKAQWQQCKCSDWQARDRTVATAGSRLRLATSYPALPDGVDKVSVTFPGSTVPSLADLPVSSAPDVQVGEPTDGTDATWHWQKGNSADPLAAEDWPTPLPDEASYAGFETTVIDDLITKTTTPAVRTETEQKSTTLTLDSKVMFGPDSAVLLPAARAALARIAAQLNSGAKDGSTVQVFGYVAQDNGGVSPGVAASLSTARAQAVYGVLKASVRKQVRWTVVGKGFANPVAPNDTEPHRRLNRRVTITYTG